MAHHKEEYKELAKMNQVDNITKSPDTKEGTKTVGMK